MTEKIEIATISGKRIAVSGIGRLFFEEGFPIHISVDILKEQGVEVSMLHIADELYKNGWGERAIINALSQDFPGCSGSVKHFLALATSGEPNKIKFADGYVPLYSENGYELQREDLFESLFGYPSDVAIANSEKREDLLKIMRV